MMRRNCKHQGFAYAKNGYKDVHIICDLDGECHKKEECKTCPNYQAREKKGEEQKEWENVSRQQFDELMSQEIRLNRCPRCGNAAEIVIKIPWYGPRGARVQCSRCGLGTELFDIRSRFNCDENKSTGTPILEKSIIKGVRAAIQSWNQRKEEKI